MQRFASADERCAAGDTVAHPFTNFFIDHIARWLTKRFACATTHSGSFIYEHSTRKRLGIRFYYLIFHDAHLIIPMRLINKLTSVTRRARTSKRFASLMASGVTRTKAPNQCAWSVVDHGGSRVYNSFTALPVGRVPETSGSSAQSLLAPIKIHLQHGHGNRHAQHYGKRRG